MYQIITSQYQVITIYANNLKDAITEAHDAGFTIVSIVELKQ